MGESLGAAGEWTGAQHVRERDEDGGEGGRREACRNASIRADEAR